MSDYKVFMGLLSVAIMLVAYGIYIWQTLKRGVVPHPFSWLPFGFLTLTGYLVQQASGGGAGSWVMGITAIFCFVLGILGFLKRKRGYTKRDWISLVIAILVYAFYLTTKNLMLAAILATAVDVILYEPTFRKGWNFPHEDSVTSFSLNSLKFIPSIAAMGSYSVATIVYPAAMVVINIIVAVFLVLRRRHLVVAR